MYIWIPTKAAKLQLVNKHETLLRPVAYHWRLQIA